MKILFYSIRPYLRKRYLTFLALLAIVLAPVMLKRTGAIKSWTSDRRLTVMTPHNETIQRELGAAFINYWEKKTGESLYIDWRVPGGSNEIRMVLDSLYQAADKRVADGDGDGGIGVDVLFGGGQLFFEQEQQEGRLVELNVFAEQVDLFANSSIPASFTGEPFYDDEKQWVGVCLSQFGIVYNEDGLRAIGVEAPKTWDDLADPAYFGKLALADPTKSGSVAKAFEMLVQQKMHDRLKNIQQQPGEPMDKAIARTKREGWTDGIRLIQKIAANARYFTDSATKIPHDVAQGDAVAGICIDFYGRTYNQRFMQPDGSSRVGWVAPVGGTSLSVDPVAVLRGAAEPELAQEFVSFLMSERGQLLWNGQPGSSIGTNKRALRRLPVRRDLYIPENLAQFTDPEAMPFETSGDFVYDPELTQNVFGSLRFIIRVMCMDSHDELKSAWKSLIDADFPVRAMAIFNDVSEVSYEKAQHEIKRAIESGSKIDLVEQSIRKGTVFRVNFSKVKNMADKGR